jgi:hypothetical protein
MTSTCVVIDSIQVRRPIVPAYPRSFQTGDARAREHARAHGRAGGA